MNGLTVYSREYKTRNDLIKDLMWDDTDVVIMENQQYLINKSFLQYFDGYKNIYPEISKAYISYEYGSASADYEMNYIPYWMIQGDSIYLIGISLNTDRGQLENGKIIYPDFRLPIERFLRMEKLVKKKFEKTEEPMVDIKGMSSRFSCGRMFASRVSGVYYIKPVMEFDYDIDTWKKEPIMKLTIKDGKIIKTEEV
ncbi:MAG: hypothetical protein ACRDCN_11820 [Tannerellaceae bacterium]